MYLLISKKKKKQICIMFQMTCWLDIKLTWQMTWYECYVENYVNKYMHSKVKLLRNFALKCYLGY